MDIVGNCGAWSLPFPLAKHRSDAVAINARIHRQQKCFQKLRHRTAVSVLILSLSLN